MMRGSRLGYGKEKEVAAATMAPCREVGDGRYIEEICNVAPATKPCRCWVVVTATAGATFPIYPAHRPMATKAPFSFISTVGQTYLLSLGSAIHIDGDVGSITFRTANDISSEGPSPSKYRRHPRCYRVDEGEEVVGGVPWRCSASSAFAPTPRCDMVSNIQKLAQIP